MRSITLVLGAILLWGCGASEDPGAAAPKVLRFTAIPDQNTTELKRKYDPVAAYLSQRLGIEVEYVPARSYPASVEMFENGSVLLAWFGGLTGVQARHAVKGAHAIAQGAEDPKFVSYFIANRKTGLKESKDFPAVLAGLKFTFGSAGSTSGRLMPEYFILQHTGKDAQAFFANTPNYSGSHDKTAELVDSGQFEAGVLNYKVFEKRRKAGRTKNCVVIWRTPEYADYNFTAHPDIEKLFGEGTTERLKRALLDMKDKKLLGAFQRSALIEADDDDFAGIRKVARSLDLLGGS